MTVAQWEKNPLFRLLAFLDIVGLQQFDIGTDLTSNGTFIHTDQTFGAGTPVREILLCGLEKFRSNVLCLFTNEGERASVLQLVGETENVSTEFSTNLLYPSSLATFVDSVENDLPIVVLLRIKEVFGLTGSISPTPLVEQFLIDALDEWMGRRSTEENDKMVLACGVHPTVLSEYRARAEEIPSAVQDFIIDVVFPPPWSVENNEYIIDWLIVSYEKCYEIIDVDDDDDDADDDDDDALGRRSKRSRSEPEYKGEEDLNEDDESEELLTAKNLDRYMLERPSAVPRKILRERRKPLTDPTITMFELENHYIVTELRSFVKDVLGEKATKKAECAAKILAYHSQSTGELSVIPETVSEGSGGAASATSVVAKVREGADVASLRLDGPPLTEDDLMKGFLLREMKDFITTQLREKAPGTKQQCAALIMARRTAL